MKLFWILTGGRPMVKTATGFRDIVSGHYVNYYRDRLGREWLATSPWASSRIAIARNPARQKDSGH